MKRIYLDHAATTPMSASVRAAMEPWLSDGFGNPSSLHEEGRRARAAIDEARETIAERLGCLFGEICFTSSGSEAVNLAVVGTAWKNRGGPRNRILVSAAEHVCALDSVSRCSDFGYEVQRVRATRNGQLDQEHLGSLLAEDVLLVSALHANNELGTIDDAAAIGSMAHAVGALYHCDAVQSFMQLDWTVRDLRADLVSLSAHKIYGPKGVGALYVRSGVKPAPLVIGGGQERELRAGTENVAGIAGFAQAVKDFDSGETGAARDAFVNAILKNPNGLVQTVEPGIPTLPSHAHFLLPGATAETALILLDRLGVSASSGAACSSGSIEPSHVLLACGHSVEAANGGLRFSFGSGISVADALQAADRVQAAAAQLSA